MQVVYKEMTRDGKMEFDWQNTIQAREKLPNIYDWTLNVVFLVRKCKLLGFEESAAANISLVRVYQRYHRVSVFFLQSSYAELYF